jgi:hypothetical protein
MNFFYRNLGTGKFQEAGLTSGLGFNEDGQAEAGMGVDAAYLDAETAPDIYVTHLDNELNRLYRNLGKALFRDGTIDAGLGAERSLRSGFGVKFADFDNSGEQQIVVANGHILDNIALFHPRVAYRELLSLFQETSSGHFRDVSSESGEPFTKLLLGRGLATSDLDGDGFVDFVVSQNAGPPLIAHNRTMGGNWITLELQGTGKSNRDAIGAEVTLTAGGRVQRAQIIGSASYCSASDLHLHFGLGSARSAERLTIHWPSGRVETFTNLPANQLKHITENQAGGLPVNFNFNSRDKSSKS